MTDLPLPPLEMRKLVKPADLKDFDNPDVRPSSRISPLKNKLPFLILDAVAVELLEC